MSRRALLQFLDLFPFKVNHTKFPNEDCIELLYDCINLPDKEFYHLFNRASNKGLSLFRFDNYSDELNNKLDAIFEKAFGYPRVEHLNICRRYFLRFCSLWDTLYNTPEFPHEHCIELLYDCIDLPAKEFYELYTTACDSGLSFVRSDDWLTNTQVKFDEIATKLSEYDPEQDT